MVMERNIDLVLDEMGIKQDYYHLPSGHLRHRDSQGYPYGRGHGGHRGGGGSCDGRGNFSRRQCSQLGPAVGDYNPADE